MAKIFHKEEYQIFDRLRKTKGMQGWVRLFLSKNGQKISEPLVDKSNLITAQGREFAAQKLFEINAYDSGNRPVLYDYKISHFAVGQDGATVDNNVVTIIEPDVSDTHLYNAINLGSGAYLTEPGGTDNAVKPITTDGSILLEPITYGSVEYYTQVKCTCLVNNTEPTSLSPQESIKISEAGLYFTKADDAKMFSHICFSPKWKEKDSEIMIEWFILF